MTWEDSDVVVIGGGLAGMTAANRAAEHGLRVTLLEAGTSVSYLCNSRLVMGFFVVAFHDIFEPVEVLRAAVDEMTEGTADPALADMICQEVFPAVAWLKRQGVRAIHGTWRPGTRTMLAPPAAVGAGLRWPGRGGDRMLRRLEANLVARGGRIVRGARARTLLMAGDRCVGVKVDQGDAEMKIGARAVVIADGGFQADPDLLRRYVVPHPEKVLMRNARTGRGDGLRMAMEVGADVRGMENFYGHVQSADALYNNRLWPYPTVDFPITGGIAVDRTGRRFTDEGRGGIAVANAIARQSDPLGTTAIFDHRIWQDWATSFPLPANPLLVRHGATIHVAGSIGELALLAGIPAAALSRTVGRYNDAVAIGEANVLGPPRSVDKIKALPVSTPPFYAVPLVAGVTYTMGGIAIDDGCRVIRRGGSAIDGLYAAGASTGGLEGGPHAGYTGGLSKALTFGWRCANVIAASCGAHLAAGA